MNRLEGVALLVLRCGRRGLSGKMLSRDLLGAGME